MSAKKKVLIIIIAVACVVALCLCFYFIKHRATTNSDEVSEVQKLIARDMDGNYPSTPREVIKLYNRIIACYYGGDYTEDEFDALTEQTELLFDDDLVAENPLETYREQVKEDVAYYQAEKKTIVSTDVCDSKDVTYINDPDTGDDIAYVEASYFLKDNKSYDRTYQEYVLRKDDEGRWKILVYYQVEGDSDDDDD